MKKRDPILLAFGRNVRALREKRNLTQEALAEKAGLDRTYISDIERGVRNQSNVIGQWSFVIGGQAKYRLKNYGLQPPNVTHRLWTEWQEPLKSAT